ncbi:hypothetical protein QNI23_009170 [Bermanella sp. WJH001]|uniref:hypothetical protein n=1 Tax=Bermanella sp. WJH001 TaxID=3048005 RepID=UPI0024BECECD|nr:hypothetical protein [Bermanella sp. WJH001]MDJ1537163.1 hypothetical protein [Bermanella sp. WJH001]
MPKAATSYTGAAITKVVENIDSGKSMEGVYKAGVISAAANTLTLGLGKIAEPAVKSMTSTMKTVRYHVPIVSVRPNVSNPVTRNFPMSKQVPTENPLEAATVQATGENIVSNAMTEFFNKVTE